MFTVLKYFEIIIFSYWNYSIKDALYKKLRKEFITRLYKNTIKFKILRIRQVLQDVTERLPVRAVQKSAKRPDEAEQVKPLDVQLSANLVVVGQHRAQEAQAGLEHAHQRQGQAGPERGKKQQLTTCIYTLYEEDGIKRGADKAIFL